MVYGELWNLYHLLSIDKFITVSMHMCLDGFQIESKFDDYLCINSSMTIKDSSGFG